MLEPYRDRLDSFWAPEQVEEIEADHRCLLKMYRDDENTLNMIDKHDSKTLFNDAWDCVPRLKRLRPFCGGLAAIFPNTTARGKRFLHLEVELDEFRTGLMHLSLAALKQLWA